MSRTSKYQSGVKWNKIKSNEYELSGRKAVKFKVKFKTYKDYVKESKALTIK